jgi:hypothetical protein
MARPNIGLFVLLAGLLQTFADGATAGSWGDRGPYAVFALSFFPYRSSFSKIGQNFLVYLTALLGVRGQNPEGFQSFLSFIAAPAAWFNAIALATVGWVIWGTRAM